LRLAAEHQGRQNPEDCHANVTEPQAPVQLVVGDIRLLPHRGAKHFGMGYLNHPQCTAALRLGKDLPGPPPPMEPSGQHHQADPEPAGDQPELSILVIDDVHNMVSTFERIGSHGSIPFN
jgi:hypothetical protein